jgi:hypothetical protein
MPIRTYTRKLAPTGNPADPTKGAPSFSSGILTALSGRTWRTAADGSDVVLNIDGGDLTQQEDDGLTAAYTAWVSTDTLSYAPNFPVTTPDKGLVQQTDWYETDNGDGTYSGLARSEENTWAGGGANAVITSTTTTRYAKDGTTLGNPKIDSYYTTDDGKRVKKVTYG